MSKQQNSYTNMNILYILGNGFDKAQGMATSYPEFYEYLVNKIKDESALLNKMKLEITEDTVLWSDMEIGLGEFTTITDDTQEFDDFYFELSEHLQHYLKTEDDKYTPTDKLKYKFQSDFTTISQYLGELDKRRFDVFLGTINTSTKDINVITLNYTNTLEKILDLNAGVRSKSFSNSTNLHNIIHVHGKLGESIIIGVDHPAQMKNETFRNNDDIKDIMIKIESNESMKETRHMQCERLIANANVIILFGVSLGETDARWWKLIGQNLSRRKNLAIIQHLYNPGAIVPTQRQKMRRLERWQREHLMQRMGVKKENWTDEIKDRLFITVNESILKL